MMATSALLLLAAVSVAADLTVVGKVDPNDQEIHSVLRAGGAHRPKWGAGIYNDTLRAAPFYAQLPAACNLTGADGWVLLFFETIDGGVNYIPPPQSPAQCDGSSSAAGGKVCGCHADGSSIDLSCPDGGRISKVDFAAIGNPMGLSLSLSVCVCVCHSLILTLSLPPSLSPSLPPTVSLSRARPCSRCVRQLVPRNL